LSPLFKGNNDFFNSFIIFHLGKVEKTTNLGGKGMISTQISKVLFKTLLILKACIHF